MALIPFLVDIFQDPLFSIIFVIGALAIGLFQGIAYEAALTDAVATDVAQNDNFNQQLVIQHGREFYRNTEHVRESLFHAIGGMMPYQCLDRVKTYLTRHLTKPDDCPIRQFVGKLRHMNECELPHLPPRDANNSFTEHELKSIVWSAIPKEWGLEMQRQAFNRNEGTLEEMTNSLERYENYIQEMQALRFGSESEEEPQSLVATNLKVQIWQPESFMRDLSLVPR